MTQAAAGVGAATEAYQALLEGHRAHPDDEDLHRDILKAKASVEVAWLEAGVAGGERFSRTSSAANGAGADRARAAKP